MEAEDTWVVEDGAFSMAVPAIVKEPDKTVEGRGHLGAIAEQLDSETAAALQHPPMLVERLAFLTRFGKT